MSLALWLVHFRLFHREVVLSLSVLIVFASRYTRILSGGPGPERNHSHLERNI
jgi:hypothetical protein